MAGSRILGLITVIYCNPAENFDEVPSLTAAKSLAHRNRVSHIQCRILFIFEYIQYGKQNFFKKGNTTQQNKSKKPALNPAHAEVSNNLALNFPGLGFHIEDFTADFHL